MRAASPVVWLWRSGVAGDGLALAVLVGLTVLFYRHLIFGDRIASEPSLFRETYPLRQLIGSALREGSVPLWNPYAFTGVPLMPDVRSAVLYPATQLLRWWDAPEAFAISVAGHGMLAVIGMYLCCRFGFSLVQAGAFVGAAVFGLGGFLGANAIEPNVVEAAAWAPLVLLGGALAQRRALIAGVALGAAALALSALAGQPQVTVLLALALWLMLAVFGLPAAPERWRPDRRWLWASAVRLSRALVVAAAVPALAAALAAAQLLPYLEWHEAARQASRLTGDGLTAEALPAGALLRAILPGFSENPPRSFTSHVGVVALGLAVLGLRRGARPALFGLLATITGIALALGDATPAHGLWQQALDGRVVADRPVLGLLLLSLGLAVLAGSGLDAAWPRRDAVAWRTGWKRHWRDAVAGLALVQVVAVLLLKRDELAWPGAGIREIWLGLAVIAVDVALVLPLLRPRWWLSLAVAPILAAELVVAGAQLPFTHTADRVAFAVEPAITALLRAGEQPARVARVAGVAEGDLPPEPGFAAFQSLREGRDRLAPNTALLDRVNTLETLPGALAPAPQVQVLWAAGGSPGVLPADIRGPLAPRLGVTHVMGPPREPVVAGAAEFIAGVPLDVGPGGEVRLSLTEPRASTGVALLADLTGAPADGQPAVELVVAIAGAPDRVRTLVAGVDVGDTQRLVTDRLVELPDGGAALATEQPLGAPAVLQSLTLRNLSAGGRLRIFGLSLLDDRSGVSRPVLLDDTLAPVPGASPALYVDRRTPPRAALVRAFEVEPDAEAAVQRLVKLPLDRVLVDRPPAPSVDPNAAPGPESARIAQYTFNRVTVLVTAGSPALLVLRDAYADGWRVTVDGRPAELLRVDGLFRGVVAPEGSHSVEFRYTPPGLDQGLTFSALALLGTVAMLLLVAPRPGFRRSARR